MSPGGMTLNSARSFPELPPSSDVATMATRRSRAIASSAPDPHSNGRRPRSTFGRPVPPPSATTRGSASWLLATFCRAVLARAELGDMVDSAQFSSARARVGRFGGGQHGQRARDVEGGRVFAHAVDQRQHLADGPLVVFRE